MFDSGVGGLSVLRHIQAQLPRERLLYFADSAYAPYGDKTEREVVERSLQIAAFLIERGAKALVVACNTATVAAIQTLRAHYPAMLLVGVEPGLKPAAALTRNGMVGVMATGRTLAGDKFLQLREQIGGASKATFLLQACVGLVERIERGELDGEATLDMLDRYLAPLLAQGIDTLVLGCTHYPFVQGAIEQVLARRGAQAVTLVDTGAAVARQLTRLLAGAGRLREAHADAEADAASLHAYTSADAATLALGFARLLQLAPPVQESRLASHSQLIA